MSINHTIDATDHDQFVSEWEHWRAANETRRRDPYGFLAYSSVHRLTTRPQRFDDVPGAWATGVGGPVVELGDGETLVIEGHAITGRHEFGAIAEREFRRAAQFGDVILELSRRGGIDLLRPLDPTHGLREGYLETPAYEPDPVWIVRGEYFPFPSKAETEIDAAIPWITHHHDAVGEVVFELGGQEHRLLFLDGPARGQGTAFAVFTDATSGVTTYPASRSLTVTLPTDGGAVDLDFNCAGNLQCAYTDFSPCPLAPAQNRLPVAVVAGEKIPVFAPGTVRPSL